MHTIKNISFKGYKAFSKEQHVSMNNISNVNVIIGKNNSGKTSLLDVMQCVYNYPSTLKVGFDIDEILFDIPFDDEIISGIFSGVSGIGRWNKTKLSEFTKGQYFPTNLKIDDTVEIKNRPLRDLGGHINAAYNIICSRKKAYRFRKISAERDILPESEFPLSLSSNGDGASNIIATFLNDSNYDETLIEKTFLNALNQIMMPESEFESIRIQQVTHNTKKLWEVYLQEKGSIRVPLSKTGSGLKTIVLVLLNLLIIPHIEEYKDKIIVYGFEELENNLHPALQRRLFEYI